MSNFTYERKGTSTYLVYPIDASEEVDTMCLGMITNNSIKGLVPTTSIVLNGQRLVQYDVSSKVTAKQILSDVVTSKRLLGIFSGIADALLAAEEYMISPDNFVMDLEYMYVDVSDFHTQLVCLPVQKEQADFDLAVFLKEIMFRIRIDQSENNAYFTRLLNVLNTERAFSLQDFKKVVDELRMGTVQKTVKEVPRQEPVKATPVFQQRVEPVQSQIPREPQAVKMPVKQQAPVKPVSPVNPVNPVMATPRIPNVPNVEKAAAGLLPNGEKPMSMMYLLQHYSKENAAKYKAQKELMKNQKPAAQPKPTQSKKNKSKKQDQAIPAFQIPGQTNSGFAVPSAPMDGQATSQVMPQVPQSAPQVQSVIEQVMNERQEAAQAVQTGHMDFGKTTILDEGDSGKTVVLGMNSQDHPMKAMLVRRKNNEQILLDKETFKIGKQQGYVDYLIRDNAAISHSHANIVKKGNQYYIVDTNSTNHVFVNGQEITCNEEIPITSGAIIRLANEEFEFLLY